MMQKTSSIKPTWLLLACLTLGGPMGGLGQTLTYTLTDLGSNAWSYSAAHGINGHGGVAGEYEPTNFFYVLGFYYDNGVLSEVGHLAGAPYAIAYAANDNNEVVGESNTANATHAFLYSNGVMTDLGTLGTLNGYSSAHAINRLGHVVGEASLANVSVIHAVLYSGGNKTDLGVLGGNYSNARGINNSDVIVGESDVVSQGVTNVHAFTYTNNVMLDLGTLGGAYSSAAGINDNGVVVGEAENLVGGVSNLRAFVFRNGAMIDLGTLGGVTSSASAVNSGDQVVGYATDANEVAHAFLYVGSTMINLDEHIPPGSGWTNLASADAINDAGQIAGSGFLADGSYHGYLLTPAPPLSVAITNPLPGATFASPASFSVDATTSDSAGTVTNVEFLVNGVVVGEDPTAPYTAAINNLTLGAYILTAIASDDTGLRATNSIAVTVSDNPPTVAITNPVPNASFQAPASLVVGASASDTDGAVTNVEFLVNDLPVGNSTMVPYSAAVNNLSAGTYVLTAVATDNADLKATNSITITVTASDQPPTIAITNPVPGATFQAPASFTVQASASDSDGTVTNVQFLINGTVIGNSTTVPYSAAANNLPAGSYTLMAIATDNGNLTGTNSIAISVTNSALVPVLISNPTFGAGGFSFSFATQAGYTYAGEFTTSLAETNTWLTFTNLSGNGSTVRVTDPAPTNGQRSYRVLAH
jgi:probable HAF family extracellular repeat protein